VYGVASTISSAICVHLIFPQRALISNHADMIKLYTGMNLDVWRGQAKDIYWRDNHNCPSEEEYLEVVIRSKDRVRAMSRI
jgi:geranylgeranyl diphosphate synthase type 3